MSFPLHSTLAELDGNVQAIEYQLDRLAAGLPVNEEQLIQTFQAACQTVTRLDEQIHSERSDAQWADRSALEHLVQELKAAAEERLNQQRRARLLDLAAELDSGRVKHRLESRTTLLNKLRSQAVEELRAQAALPGPAKELPGPNTHQWLIWAFDLQDDKDAEILATLGRDFPSVEHFTAEMEESYWLPGTEEKAGPSDSGKTPQGRPGGSSAASSTAGGSAAKSHNAGVGATTKMEASGFAEVLSRPYQQPAAKPLAAPEKTVEAASAAAPTVQPSSEPVATKVQRRSEPALPTVATAVHADALPVEAPVPKPPAEEAAVEPTLISEAVEAETQTETEKPDSFFRALLSRKRPGVTWAIAAGFLMLSALLFGVIYFLHSGSSTKPNPTVEAATANVAATPNADSAAGSVGSALAATPKPNTPNAPASASPEGNGKNALLHKQPAEGAQDSILLSVENCDRGNPKIIECWGYASNLGGANSRVSLDRVDVVDGKGNSFSLDRKGQFAFPTGQSSSIAAGSRVKFTITVPDADLEARTLTLYMDLSNPRSLEYTFRNVPVAE